MGFPLKQPHRARLIARLSHEPIRHVHMGAHEIDFDYDGEHIEDRVVVRPCVPMVGNWSRTSNTVFIDRKVPQKERTAVAVHEAVEKYAAQAYGLDPFFDAHVVATGPEMRVAHSIGLNAANYDMEMEGIFRANLRRHKGRLNYGFNR